VNTDNEIYNFCTIFDSGYYSKGLALYHSLQKVCNFHLYIFTPDKRCIQLLEDKNLPNSTVINFNNIEDEELLAVKSGLPRIWKAHSNTFDPQTFHLPFF